MACQILVLRPGIEPLPSAMEAQSPNHGLPGKSTACLLCGSTLRGHQLLLQVDSSGPRDEVILLAGFFLLTLFTPRNLKLCLPGSLCKTTWQAINSVLYTQSFSRHQRAWLSHEIGGL